MPPSIEGTWNGSNCGSLRFDLHSETLRLGSTGVTEPLDVLSDMLSSDRPSSADVNAPGAAGFAAVEGRYSGPGIEATRDDNFNCRIILG